MVLNLSDLEYVPADYRPTPACCRNCVHWDGEYSDWDGTFVRFCAKNVWTPYRKQTCKKQQPYAPKAEADASPVKE
jgi:hypothetical protein